MREGMQGALGFALFVVVVVGMMLGVSVILAPFATWATVALLAAVVGLVGAGIVVLTIAAVTAEDQDRTSKPLFPR